MKNEIHDGTLNSAFVSKSKRTVSGGCTLLVAWAQLCIKDIRL